MRNKNLRKITYSSGFTLVELMVALLILAIGLLGLAGLQARGLGSNHNAYLRTQATLLAQDMADRMRANFAGVVGGYYNNTATQNTNCATTAGCSAQELAKNDYWEWITPGTGRMTVADLPSGTGMISSNGGVYTITISWVERENSSDNTSSTVTKTFAMSFQP